MQMNNTHKLKFTFNVAWQKIKEKELFYIYDIPNMNTYTFDDSGYYILCGIENHMSINEICLQFVDMYGIDFETAHSDIVEFVGEISSLGMVENYA